MLQISRKSFIFDKRNTQFIEATLKIIYCHVATLRLKGFINHQPDIDEIYLNAEGPYEEKYQFLINKQESTDINHFSNPETFIEYTNDMEGIYKNIEGYNPNKEQKILIVLDDMIAGILSNKKRNPVVTELFIRGRKLNISLVFITQPYFAVPKNAFNHLSDIKFQDFRIFTKNVLKNHIYF